MSISAYCPYCKEQYDLPTHKCVGRKFCGECKWVCHSEVTSCEHPSNLVYDDVVWRYEKRHISWPRVLNRDGDCKLYRYQPPWYSRLWEALLAWVDT
jgi:hypothetical protein